MWSRLRAWFSKFVAPKPDYIPDEFHRREMEERQHQLSLRINALQAANKAHLEKRLEDDARTAH